VYNFADEYSRLATEEHGSHPIPGRLPTEREVSDIISTVEYSKNLLESVRNLVQQSLMNERAREGGRSKGSYDDEDVSMYGDGSRSSYDMAGVKKRRGVSRLVPSVQKVLADKGTACRSSRTLSQLQPS
jgi:hypothetical protein